MNKAYLLLFPVCFLLTGCLTAKFNKSGDYTGTEKPKSLYVIVAGDEQTEACLNYYKEDMIDSINHHHITATGEYECCVNEKTNLNDYMNNLLTKAQDHPYILTAVITKVIIGYGTSSSRTLQLNLFDIQQRKSVWSGKLTTDFSWFINDQNYRNVAQKISATTIKELKLKGIIE